MLLRGLTVENWRCFAGRLELGPFGDRLNVVHGPNGAGKSSLMAALSCGMFDRHDTKAEPLKAHAPWGRDLTPSVAIEFEHGGTRYRLRKRFLRDTSAVLERDEAGQFTPVADGKKACEAARRFLDGEAPKRGLADAAQWGLAQVLWTPQQRIAVGDLSGGVRAAIQDVLGAKVDDVVGNEVIAAIEAAYLDVFTPGGKLKGGANAPFQHDAERIAALRQERAERREQLVSFEEAGRQVENHEHRLAQVRRDRQARDEELQRTQTTLDAYRAVRTRVERREAEAEAVRAKHADLARRVAQIAETEQSLQALRERVAQLEETTPALKKSVEQADAELNAATKLRSDARASRENVVDIEQTARTAEQHERCRESAEKLAAQIERLEQVEQERTGLQDERSAIAAPDAKRIERLAKLLDERRDAQVRWEASLVAVELSPERPLTIDVETADRVTGTGEETAAPTRIEPSEGETVRMRGESGVVFRIDGVGMFRATGPGGDGRRWKERLDELRGEIESLTLTLGSDDLDVLRERSALAATLDREIAQRNELLATILANETAEQLRAAATETRETLQRIEEQYPEWRETPPEATKLRDEAQRERIAADQRLREAETQEQTAREKLDAARRDEAKHGVRLEETLQQSRGQEETLARLTDDGFMAPERKAALDRLALDIDAANQGLKADRQELDAFEHDPAETVASLKEHIARLLDEESASITRLEEAKAGLRHLSREAPHARLSEIEEQLAELERTHETMRVRQEAIRLLQETVSSARSEIVRSLLDPIAKRVRQILERVAGPRLGGVELSEGFELQAVAPPTAGATVAVDRLSGGEQEQVHFAVRMALADVLWNERTLLVFDDAFVASDSARLTRIQRVLEEMTDRFQVLVFTCHPERYPRSDGATFLDLESAVRS